MHVSLPTLSASSAEPNVPHFSFFSVTCLEIHDKKVSDGAIEEPQSAVDERRRVEAAQRVGLEAYRLQGLSLCVVEVA